MQQHTHSPHISNDHRVSEKADACYIYVHTLHMYTPDVEVMCLYSVGHENLHTEAVVFLCLNRLYKPLLPDSLESIIKLKLLLHLHKPQHFHSTPFPIFQHQPPSSCLTTPAPESTPSLLSTPLRWSSTSGKAKRRKAPKSSSSTSSLYHTHPVYPVFRKLSD